MDTSTGLKSAPHRREAFRFSGWDARAAWRVAEAVESCDLKIAGPRGVAEARALAAEALGPSVAPVEALIAIQRRSGTAVLVYEEEGVITGALGVLPLSPLGLDALLNGRLDLSRPVGAFFAGGRTRGQALYAMGIVSVTPQAARAVVTGVVRLREAFSDIGFYARAVTAAGRRVLIERLGCRDLPGTPLMWSPPDTTALEIAA